MLLGTVGTACAGGTTATTPEVTSTTFGGLTTTTICNVASSACRQTSVLAAARQLTALDDLTDEQLVQLMGALCAHLESIAADPSRRPASVVQLGASTAASLGVTVDQVDALLTANEQTCPTGEEAVEAIEGDAGPVPILLSASGADDLSVTYSLPDGSSHQEQVANPWEVVVNYPEPIDVAMAVATEEGSAASCRIALGDVVLSETGAGQAGGRVVCNASKDQIEGARRGR